MRGRKPKPLQQKIAEGDPGRKGKHKLAAALLAEPQAQKGLPACPRYLRGRARHAWNYWKAELEAMDLDRRPDAMMLEGACVAWDRAVEADLIYKRDGPLVEIGTLDKHGEKVVLKIQKHPAEAISTRAWLLVHRFCSEFGLSPVSRRRLPTADKPSLGADDLMDRLTAPREKRPGEAATVQ